MNDHADTLRLTREIRVMEKWLELRLARAHSVIIGTKDHAVHEALSEVKVRLDAIRAAALSQQEAAPSVSEDYKRGWFDGSSDTAELLAVSEPAASGEDADCDVCHEPLADGCACQDEYRREHDSGAER